MEPETILFYLVALFTAVSAVAVLVSQNIVRSAVWLLFTLAGTAGIFFLLGADFVAATQLIIYVGGILVLVVFGVMLTAQGPFITMKVSAAEWVIASCVGLLLLGVLVTSIPNAYRFGGASVVPIAAPSNVERASRLAALQQEIGSLLKDKYSKKGKGKRINPDVDPLSKSERARLEALVKERDSLRPGRRENPVTSSLNSAVLGEALLGIDGVTPRHSLHIPGAQYDVPRTRVSYLLPFEIVSVHLLVVLIGAAYLARAKRRRGAVP